MRVLSYIVFCAVFLLTASIQGRAEEGTFGIWSETLDLSKVTKQLPTLSKYRTDLHLAILSSKLKDEQLWSLLKQAEKLNVSVRAWLLLPDADGYWPCMENAKKFRILVNRFLNEAQRRNVRIPWVIVDMEPSLSAIVSGSFNGNRGRNHLSRFNNATHEFQQMVLETHERGVKVHVVTFPQILDDKVNGNQNQQHWFGTPIDHIEWDEISFMAYTGFFPWISVSKFAEKLHTHYPKIGGIELGPIGFAGKVLSINPHQFLSRTVNEILKAREKGIKSIRVFSLDGLVGNWSLKDPRHWIGGMSQAFFL